MDKIGRRLRAGGVAAGGAAVLTVLVLAMPQVLAGAPVGMLPLWSEPPGQRYHGTVLVVEGADPGLPGARLCPASWPWTLPYVPGQVPDPVSCAGPAPEVVGWDWAGLDATTDNGLTWGFYYLVGSWDGERFTPTEPPATGDPADGPGLPADQPGRFDTPCPEPDGGWRPVDPDLATGPALDQTLAWVETIPEYAGAWVDQSVLDGQVLNLRFTGDPAGWEEQVRQHWGGPLCLTGADYRYATLLEIQGSLHAEYPPGGPLLSSGPDVIDNTLYAEVLVAEVAWQRELDQRFGAGAVTLAGWLEPLPDPDR